MYNIHIMLYIVLQIQSTKGQTQETKGQTQETPRAQGLRSAMPGVVPVISIAYAAYDAAWHGICLALATADRHVT